MVRDRVLGVTSKDADFAVEAESFDVMLRGLRADGVKIFQERPEYFTARGQFAADDVRTAIFCTRDADFVLCRRDGVYSDGRRPSDVTPGTLLDDLTRRDFTMNAVAIDEDGQFVDPFGGLHDIQERIIRSVGDPFARISEDWLRALRAVRFLVTKDSFKLDDKLREVLSLPVVAENLALIPHERRSEELRKMFAYDTVGALRVLAGVGPAFLEASLSGLRLDPTGRKKL